MIPTGHPCLSAQTHFRYGRIYLPMTPRCNVRYGYCDRRYDYINESRPGVTSEVTSPEATLGHVERALRLNSHLRVAGVAGPGGPLTNPATLETPRLIHARLPRLLLRLGTGGLVLPDTLPGLLNCGVPILTVTINVRSVICTGHVYRAVGGSTDTGAMVAFLSVQQEDMTKATEIGFTMKINTVVIPDFNTGKIEEIACQTAYAGATVMNLMPPIPQADFQDNEPPSRALLETLRAKARVCIPQFAHCRQCRVGAVGVPGEMDYVGCL